MALPALSLSQQGAVFRHPYIHKKTPTHRSIRLHLSTPQKRRSHTGKILGKKEIRGHGLPSTNETNPGDEKRKNQVNERQRKGIYAMYT
jgi:hypothetical protein